MKRSWICLRSKMRKREATRWIVSSGLLYVLLISQLTS